MGATTRETVEEFVEALILTTANPRATRLTPSRGDKGVDIIAPVGDQFDVYQVKRYTRPFGKSSTQEKSIVSSWKRFVREILPTYPIRRWNLVMPWNPTPERYDWMLNDLTAGALIERDWVGRGQLDVWTSKNRALQDYFFGDGQNRTIELIAAALSMRQEIPDLTGEPLLSEESGDWLQIVRNLVKLQGVCAQQLTVPVSLSGAEVAEIESAVRLLEGNIIQSDWISTQFVIKNIEALNASLSTGPFFQFLFFRPFSIEYDDMEFMLDGTVGTWGVAQLADPTVVDSIAPGDSVEIVPGADQKISRQYSPKAVDTLFSGKTTGDQSEQGT